MNQEDVLVNRLKYTQVEVYEFFSVWWNEEVRKVNSNEKKNFPDRRACDKFLAKYGWDLPSLLTVLDLGTDDMVE